jgi:hypothetical protein
MIFGFGGQLNSLSQEGAPVTTYKLAQRGWRHAARRQWQRLGPCMYG